MANLGEVSPEALEKYTRLVQESMGLEYAEEGDSYDFARCMRPDGSFYGTSGKCRKGSEAGAKEKVAPGAKAAGAGKESIRREFAAAAKDYKSRIDDLKSELKRSDADPKAIKEQIAMWAGKLKFALERASGGGDAASKKVAAQTRESNRQALAGVTDAARRKTETEKRRGVDSEKTRQLGETQRQLFDAAKERRARAKEAERVAKELTKRAKADPGNKELKQRAFEANRYWDKAGTAADRAQVAWMKAHEKWSKQSERDKRAQMSPEQRREARKVDAIIRERG